MERITSLDLKPILSKPLGTTPSPQAVSTSFGDLIKEAINKVDEAQKESDHLLQDFMGKKSNDLHEVVIAWEKADISLKLLMQVRSKVLEAYQEVMRMSV